MTLPKWIQDDLKKTGPEFWRSRFFIESMEKSIAIYKWMVAAGYVYELLVEVHGKAEGERQFNILLADALKSPRPSRA